nr:MAG TPA: hypothetical protein [Caudoviricetes sp.]
MFSLRALKEHKLRRNKHEIKENTVGWIGFSVTWYCRHNQSAH